MNFNRVELKWSQFGVKAINMDFKIIPHINVTHSPSEIRRVTHLNSIKLQKKEKNKLPPQLHSVKRHIQQKLYPAKQEAEAQGPSWSRRSRVKQHLLVFAPLACQPGPTTGQFLLRFFRHYGIHSSSAVARFTPIMLILCSSPWFSCYPSLPSSRPSDATRVTPRSGLSSLRLPLFQCISANLKQAVAVCQAT